MPTTKRDYLLMHLVVIAWGFTAILGKLLTSPPVDVTIWRTGIAVLSFAFIAWLAGGARISVGQGMRFALTGAVLGLHWVLFFWAARLSTASVCLAAMPTAMLWCSLIEPVVDGTRKWRPLELVIGLVMVLAVWIIYQVEFSHWKGFTVAIAAAFLAAIFAVFSKQQVGACHWSRIGAWQMSGAFLAALLCRPFLEQGFLPELPQGLDVLWTAILALVCTVAAYAGFMKALREMSVFAMNVIYNLEPVYGIVLAAMVFGSAEIMSAGFYLGAGIIVASVVSLPWLRKWIGE